MVSEESVPSSDDTNSNAATEKPVVRSSRCKNKSGKVTKKVHKAEREKLKGDCLNVLFLKLNNALGNSIWLLCLLSLFLVMTTKRITIPILSILCFKCPADIRHIPSAPYPSPSDSWPSQILSQKSETNQIAKKNTSPTTSRVNEGAN